jgi:hypothetical protein
MSNTTNNTRLKRKRKSRRRRQPDTLQLLDNMLDYGIDY